MSQGNRRATPAAEPRRSALLVESGATLAVLLQALLVRQGFSVATVDGEAGARDALARNGFDLVVVGGCVRGADAIAAACAERTVPVLAITAEGGAAVGATATLGMPIDRTAFADTVVRCLAARYGTALSDAGIDADAIRELWESTDDPRFLRVVRVFLGELSERLGQIEALLAADERRGLEREAHSVKGAAANVGAARIRAAAMALESRSRSADPQELAALAATLRAAADTGAAGLHDLLRGSDA